MLDWRLSSLSPPCSCSFILLLICSGFSWAQSVNNVTVEDYSDNIVYSPPELWTAEQSCTDCESMRTWHQGQQASPSDPLFPTSASLYANFSFSGSAIYVFGVHPPASPTPYPTSTPSNDSRFANMSFWIDGLPYDGLTPERDRQLSAANPDTYQYDVLLFSLDSLDQRDHTFSLVSQPYGNSSRVLLDYFIYTELSDDLSLDDAEGATVSASSTNIGAIVGGVLGAIAFLLLILLAFLAWYALKHDRPLCGIWISHPRDWFSPWRPPRPPSIDPDKLVATSKMNMEEESQGPAVDLTRGEDRFLPPPENPLTPKQRRIMAWQRQTAEATAAPNSEPSVRPVSDVLSSYWDPTTESYRDWDDRPPGSPALPAAVRQSMNNPPLHSPPQPGQPISPLSHLLRSSSQPLVSPAEGDSLQPRPPAYSMPLHNHPFSSAPFPTDPLPPLDPPSPPPNIANSNRPRRSARRLTVMNN